MPREEAPLDITKNHDLVDKGEQTKNDPPGLDATLGVVAACLRPRESRSHQSGETPGGPISITAPKDQSRGDSPVTSRSESDSKGWSQAARPF